MFLFSVLIGIAFHGGEKPRVAVFVGGPCGYNAPKMHGPVIADLSYNDFYLSAFNDRDDTPIANRFALPDTLLVPLNFKLFYGFFKLLIGRRKTDEFDGERQEFESQDLRWLLAFRARTLENEVIKSFGSEMNLLPEGRGHNAPNATIELGN